MGTGEKSTKKDWNLKERRVRASHPNFPWTNEELSRYENAAIDAYRELKLHQIPITLEKVRKRISQLLNIDPTKRTILDYYTKFMDQALDFKTENTIKKYITTKNHLLEYCFHMRKTLEFADIDMEFYREFTRYLMHYKGHTNNTIVKQIKVLKTFMNWATEEGFNHYNDYRKFETKETYGEVIFLTQDELFNLYDTDFSNRHLNMIRDVFALGCFTGMRFSDIKNLQSSNFVNDQIVFNIQKTKTRHSIPLNEFARELVSRYLTPNGFTLQVISNQKTNQGLKKIAKLSGFDDDISIVRFRGANRVEETKKKWELITTHCARKTFITNSIYLGMKSEVVMKIANIKSHRVFQRYYDIVDDVKRDEMQRVWSRKAIQTT